MPPARVFVARLGKPALLAALLTAALIALLPIAAPAPGASVAEAQSSNVTFNVQETTFESHYPRGMTFTIQADSSAGAITRATLFLTMRPGTRERANGDYDAERGVWREPSWETHSREKVLLRYQLHHEYAF